MLLSVFLSLLGLAGGVYCVVFSSMALTGGPLCDTGDGEYIYPFRNNTLEWVWLAGSSSLAFPDPEIHLLRGNLNFSKMDWWSTLSTPEFTLLWASMFQLVISLTKGFHVGKVPEFLPSCFSAALCARCTTLSKGCWAMSCDSRQSKGSIWQPCHVNLLNHHELCLLCLIA